MNTTNPDTSYLDLNPQRAQAHHVAAGQPRSTASKRSRAIINLIGAVVAFGMTAPALQAAELSPMAGESIEIGGLHGVFYYTDENDGYRVIATIADGEARVPVRFAATLAEGQSATISVPGKFGEPGQSVEMSRSGDKLIVTRAGSMSNQPMDAVGE